MSDEVVVLANWTFDFVFRLFYNIVQLIDWVTFISDESFNYLGIAIYFKKTKIYTSDQFRFEFKKNPLSLKIELKHKRSKNLPHELGFSLYLPEIRTYIYDAKIGDWVQKEISLSCGFPKNQFASLLGGYYSCCVEGRYISYKTQKEDLVINLQSLPKHHLDLLAAIVSPDRAPSIIKKVIRQIVRR